MEIASTVAAPATVDGPAPTVIKEHVPATARTEVCVSVTTVAPVQQAGLDQLVSELSALLRVSMVTVSTPRLSVSVMKAGEERTATKLSVIHPVRMVAPASFLGFVCAPVDGMEHYASSPGNIIE